MNSIYTFEVYVVLVQSEVFRDRLVKLSFKSQKTPYRKVNRVKCLISFSKCSVRCRLTVFYNANHITIPLFLKSRNNHQSFLAVNEESRVSLGSRPHTESGGKKTDEYVLSEAFKGISRNYQVKYKSNLLFLQSDEKPNSF